MPEYKKCVMQRQNGTDSKNENTDREIHSWGKYAYE